MAYSPAHKVFVYVYVLFWLGFKKSLWKGAYIDVTPPVFDMVMGDL